MVVENLFSAEGLERTKARIAKLTPQTQAVWGKMSVSQMLAHNCVAYEMALTDKHPKPNGLVRLLLKLFVKNGVVGPKPYPRNASTAPAFIIKGDRDFEAERARLLAFMDQTFQKGEKAFEGKESLSFGPLSAQEWNVLFSKHLDHHLQQFGV